MKTSQLFYIVVSILLFLSCGQKESNNISSFGYEPEAYLAENVKQQTGYNQNENSQQNANHLNTKKPTNEGLKPYKVMSKQFGIPVGIMPIPISWEISNNKKENVLFESKNGVKVYGEQFFSFSFHNNPQRNQFMQQNGSNIQPLKSLERVINEDFKPYLQSQGISFVRQYPLPQLAQFDKRFDSYLFKATPEQKQYQCMVTEWTDNKGNLSLGIIRYFVTQYPSIGGLDWGYAMNSMEAPQRVYENAKQAMINSLVNFQINPHWVQANNQYYSQMAQRSNTGHQQRMANIRSQGQAIINNGKTYSDISDSSHESWKRRNTMTDNGQSKSVNGIWERSNMTDQSGNLYQVEGYDNNVWMNNNNEYIGTDNSNYNPNIDNTTKSQNWEQLQNND